MYKKLLWLPLFFTLAACSEEEVGVNPPSSLPAPTYTPAEQDIVDQHGEITNLTRFEEFMEHVHNAEEDAIRIVVYTTEGAPILKDVRFDGDSIEYTVDTTRDGYGIPEIITANCKSIEKNETKDRTDYRLVGCDKETDTLLLVTDMK